jgi:predicted transcriptional regulator
MTYECPHCGSQYTSKDVLEVQRGKAYYILNSHGISLSAIGKLFNVEPTSVKYHLNKYKELGN